MSAGAVRRQAAREKAVSLRLVPITQAKAKAFIWKHHRHNMPSIGAVFCVGLATVDGVLVGVAMSGMPKSRMLMDGTTLEVTRVAVDGTWNANSMLYGACARAAAALGYRRLVTYTLLSESGASLKASGWKPDDEPRDFDINGWLRNCGRGSKDLFGQQRIPEGPKIRWWKELAA